MISIVVDMSPAPWYKTRGDKEGGKKEGPGGGGEDCWKVCVKRDGVTKLLVKGGR